MTMFNEREQAFEAKFAHDAEIRFRLGARRDKLFAHWAGERLGVPGAEVEAMTAAVLSVRDGAGHDERLLHLIATVFADHGVPAEPQGLIAALAECERVAEAQFAAEPPGL